jgi:hypothetical protein
MLQWETSNSTVYMFRPLRAHQNGWGSEQHIVIENLPYPKIQNSQSIMQSNPIGREAFCCNNNIMSSVSRRIFGLRFKREFPDGFFAHCLLEASVCPHLNDYEPSSGTSLRDRECHRWLKGKFYKGKVERRLLATGLGRRH